MQNVLSLLDHCKKCGGKCCIPGETIGAPIISGDELIATLKIPGIRVDQFQMVHVLSAGGYYYVPKKTKVGRCVFLSAENRCIVQSDKFADCLIYPIKAIRKDEEVVFIIDVHCPAAPQLTPEFIVQAKKIALRSLESWRAEIYQHWLDNYIQWTKDAVELDEYLKLSPEERQKFDLY